MKSRIYQFFHPLKNQKTSCDLLHKCKQCISSQQVNRQNNDNLNLFKPSSFCFTLMSKPSLSKDDHGKTNSDTVPLVLLKSVI